MLSMDQQPGLVVRRPVGEHVTAKGVTQSCGEHHLRLACADVEGD